MAKRGSIDQWRKLQPVVRGSRHDPTEAEALLWSRLRRHGLAGMKVRRQHPIAGFVADFYCHAAQLVIEVDGPIHKGQRPHDAARDDVLRSLGLIVMRVSNDDVLADVDAVIGRIRRVIGSVSAVELE